MIGSARRIVRPRDVLVAMTAFVSAAFWAPQHAHAYPAALGRTVTIAFTRPAAGVRQVFAVTPYGTGLTQITHEAVPVSDPAWSPDGSMIAFVETLSHGEALFVANADGSSVTQLSFQPGTFDGLVWSPDGTTLAMGFDPGGQGMHIWTTHIDGSRRVQVTAGTGTDTHPTWSPDGTRLGFARRSARHSHLFVIGADGTGETRVTRGRASDTAPAWSPNGATIAFSSDRAGGRHLFVVGPDGSGLMQITQDAALDDSPTWSPCGDQVGFTRHASGHPRKESLVVWTRWSGAITTATDGSNDDRTPTWQPADGYEVSLDRAAKQDEIQALSVAREYWALYGTYDGLTVAWMQSQDPNGVYVNGGIDSNGQDVSIGAAVDTFYAARLSATGECWGIRDVGGTATSYDVTGQPQCSADSIESKPWDPAWPAA